MVTRFRDYDAVLCLVLTVGLLAAMPATPLTTADSAGYVDFLPIRTAGYPVFLRVFGEFAVVAQILIFGICAFVLSRTVEGVTNRWIAGAVLLALFINPELDKLHYSILTESLFVSLDLLTLAAAIGAVAGRRTLWQTGVSIGLAATIRPAAVALLAIPLLIGLLRRDWRGLSLALTIFVTLAGGERVYAYHVHGDQLTSLAPRHLFAKAALIDAPPSALPSRSPLETRLTDALERDYAPVRPLIWSAPSAIKTSLIADYEVCIQWACQAALGIGQYSPPTIDQAMKRVAIDRIRKNPAGYFKLAWHEYLGLWSIGARTHPALAPAYDKFMLDHRPVPIEAQFRMTGALDPTLPRRSALLARPAFQILGWLTAIVTLVSLFLCRRRVLFQIAAMAAVSVQTSFAFVALTAVGYGRYTMSMWPNIVVALAFAMVGTVQWRRASSVQVQESSS